MRMPTWLNRRPLKIVFGVLLTILALQLFALWVLPSLVQSQLPAWIEKKSGHHVQMDTPAINPWAWSVTVPKLRLTTPEGQPLLAFDQLSVDLAALKLLSGTIAIQSVELQGLNLQTALLPNGQLNWTAFIQAFQTPEPDPKPEPPAFTLGHLSLQNAVLGFADQRTPHGFATQVEQINLQLHNISTQANQQGQFTLNAHTSFDAKLHIQAQVALQQPAFTGQFDLQGANLSKLADLLAPWLPSTPPSGTVGLQAQFDVRLPEGQPRIQFSQINMQAQHLKTQAKGQAPSPAFAVEAFTLSNAAVNVDKHEVQLEGLSLQGLEAQHANGQAWLGLDSIELGPLQLNWLERSAQLKTLNIKGNSLALVRQSDGQLSPQAWLAAWQTAPAGPSETPASPAQSDEKPWAYTLDTLGLALEQAQFRDETQEHALALGFKQLAFNAQHISNNLDQALPVQASLLVESGGQLSAKGSITPSNAAMQLALNLNNLNLQPFQPLLNQAAKLSLASGTVSSQGTLSNKDTLAYQGNVALNKLRLNHEGTQQTFLALEKLSAPSLQASPKAVSIPTLNVQALNAALFIAKDKTTNLAQVMRSPSPAKSAQPKTTSPAQPGLEVDIGQIKLSESTLDFSDESLLTPFSTHIHKLQGTLTGVSTKPAKRSTLNITGEVDEFGWTQAQGQLDLFNPMKFLNVKVKFDNVEMGRLSPYSVTFANRKIESGKLNLNLDYRVENQQLTSSNQVSINKLVLGERVQSPTASDLPLDLAIALLQDSDGRINLDLPISGNLDNPEFSYGAIVWKAIANVLTKAATAPFRALAALFGREEPLLGPSFLAGENTLLPPQRERVQELAQAMQKRPNLVLTIHGAWAQTDEEALLKTADPKKKPTPEQLQTLVLGLAQQRQTLVLDMLRAAGVPPLQLKTGDIRSVTPDENQSIVLDLEISTNVTEAPR
jgi:hypothetical protein